MGACGIWEEETRGHSDAVGCCWGLKGDSRAYLSLSMMNSLPGASMLIPSGTARTRCAMSLTLSLLCILLTPSLIALPIFLTVSSPSLILLHNPASPPLSASSAISSMYSWYLMMRNVGRDRSSWATDAWAAKTPCGECAPPDPTALSPLTCKAMR